MSRLLIPNTCQVPNVLFDEVMRRISDPALRVLLAVVRKTYGFQKQSDHMSLTQLEQLTGLSRQGVVNGIRALGTLLKISRGKREGNEYALNLNVETGELVNAVDQSIALTSQRSSDFTSQRGRHTKPNKNKTHKTLSVSSPLRSKKLTRQPAPASAAAFDRFYAVYPRHVGKKPALAAWLKLNPDLVLSEIIITAAARYAEQTRDTEERFVLHPKTWLSQERWTDEAPPNGHPPNEIKNLENGMIEVDGRAMDRRSYERRYAAR